MEQVVEQVGCSEQVHGALFLAGGGQIEVGMERNLFQEPSPCKMTAGEQAHGALLLAAGGQSEVGME
ncbi:hypothetical protein TNIN_6431 [Trichonephila inaurata madagascariensis]|uniref:Uncharacterized protein n=1 Tax=Trichonephila inaurata madagascariensis TaxID=2747483 RepID=A0A8X7CQX2_9ARAC|nr:hypothetical protein TNIN_6431 [Trichonephila inaurata madagascariensis]